MPTFVTPIEDLPTNIPQLKPDGTNWTVFSLRFREAMQAMRQWGYFDGTKLRPIPRDPGAPTNAEIEALKSWDHEDVVARYLLSQHLPDMTVLSLDQYQTAQAWWTHVSDEYVAKSVYALNRLEEAFSDMRRSENADVQTYLTDVRHKREELTAAGAQITEKDYRRAVLNGIPEELETFVSLLLSVASINHRAIDMEMLIDLICEEAERRKIRGMRIQQGPGGSNNGEEVTDEPLPISGSGGRRRRRRGRCHTCGKKGHWARECRAPKEEGTATAQAAHTSSGVRTQPETHPMGPGVARSLPIVIVNGDGSSEGGEEHWEVAW